MSFKGTDQWSVKLKLDDLGSLTLMLKKGQVKNFFRVDKRSEMNSTFIIIEDLPHHKAEYKIINESNIFTVKYWQQD